MEFVLSDQLHQIARSFQLKAVFHPLLLLFLECKSIGQTSIIIVDAGNFAGGSSGHCVQDAHFIGPNMGDIGQTLGQFGRDRAKISATFSM